jgi:hypothetical protein
MSDEWPSTLHQPPAFLGNGRKLEKVKLHNLLSDIDYPLPARHKQYMEQFVPHSNTSPMQDFKSVFLGHARLYALADNYGVEPLKELILYKLFKALKSFTIYETRVDGIIEFVRFSYKNTPSYDNGVDGLRKLAARYIASVLDAIAKSEPFIKLLQEGGEFVKDFWNVIWNEAFG